MTNFEEELRGDLHREAARLIPDDTTPPPLPALRTGWLAHWRAPMLIAAAVILIAGTITTIAITQRGDSTVAGPAAPDATTSPPDTAAPTTTTAPPEFTFPTISWAKDYSSAQDLANDSTNVVIASPTADNALESDPDHLPGTGAQFAAMTVDAVPAGSDIAPGDTIEVLSFADDTQGRPAFVVPGRYLLFLVPYTDDLVPGEPIFRTHRYRAVSLAAGVYYQDSGTSHRTFTRTLLDLPDLPETIDPDALQLLAGWYDAAYLDHVSVGEIPEQLPPPRHLPGAVDSEVTGGPADPFSCHGAMTTAAAQRDDARVLFGRTDTRFCASIDSGEGPVTRSELLVVATPIHAIMRIGSGWESQIAGVVDETVTAVVAIRGADNAVDREDPLPDWELDLTDIGGMRAFLATSDTREIVAYTDGAEVARWPGWIEFIDDPNGGWDHAPEIFEQRDDLSDVTPAAATHWTQLDDSTVRVFFTAGHAACYGAVVTVEETADTVAISVATGWKLAVGACDDMAVAGAVDITLEQPLGDRSVIPLSRR